MKILLPIHDFLPDRIAGVEVYTANLARQLAREHEVALLFARLDPARPDLELVRSRWEGLSTFELNHHRRFSSFVDTYADPRLRPRLEEVFAEFAPDVVHIQHFLNLSIDLVRVAKATGAVTLMTLHDHWLACANGGQRVHPERGRCDLLDSGRCADCTANWSSIGLRLRGLRQRRLAGTPGSVGAPPPDAPVGPSVFERIGKRLLRVSPATQIPRVEARWRTILAAVGDIERFIAPSRSLAEAMVEFGLPSDRIVQWDYGFPPDDVGRRPPGEFPDRAERFGSLGSIVPHKGVLELVRAFESMPAAARLDVAGDPTDHPAYAAAVRQAATHPGIRFLGGVAPKEVPAFLRGLDCLVVPSLWSENSPLCIHEAFQAGVPVLASHLGGSAELLEAGGGLLYDPDVSGTLAAALGRLTSEPGLLRSLAESVPAVCSMDEHVALLVGLYSKLAGAKSC